MKHLNISVEIKLKASFQCAKKIVGFFPRDSPTCTSNSQVFIELPNRIDDTPAEEHRDRRAAEENVVLVDWTRILVKAGERFVDWPSRDPA
jgi:hypothetical protein